MATSVNTRHALVQNNSVLQEYISPVTNTFLSDLRAQGLITEPELDKIKSSQPDTLRVLMILYHVTQNDDSALETFTTLLHTHYPGAAALLNATKKPSVESENTRSLADLERKWRSKFNHLKAALVTVIQDSEEQHLEQPLRNIPLEASGLNGENNVSINDLYLTTQRQGSQVTEGGLTVSKATLTNESMGIRSGEEELLMNMKELVEKANRIESELEAEREKRQMLQDELKAAQDELTETTGMKDVVNGCQETITSMKNENEMLTQQLRDVQANLEKTTTSSKKIEEELTLRNEQLQKRLQKATAEITKLNEELTYLWSMHHSATDQSYNQVELIKKLKQQMTVLQQESLQLEFKIKDIEKQLQVQLAEMSELSEEICKYKQELGLTKDASQQEVEERIQHLINNANNVESVKGIQDKLHTAAEGVASLQENVEQLQKEKENLETQMMQAHSRTEGVAEVITRLTSEAEGHVSADAGNELYPRCTTVEAMREDKFNLSRYSACTKVVIPRPGTVALCVQNLQGEWSIQIHTQNVDSHTKITLPSGCEYPHLANKGDELYVSDGTNQSIHVYIPVRNGQGRLVRSTKFRFSPGAIATSDEYVWVCNEKKQRICKVTMDDQYKVTNIQVVNLDNGFTNIDLIAANEERLAVCEEGGKVVHVYSHEGALLYTYEVTKSEEKGWVRDIGLGSFNFLYATDNNSSRVVIITSDGQLAHHIPVGWPCYLAVSDNTLCVLGERVPPGSVYTYNLVRS